MKKFGTPIGAAPGSANEKDGFDALGVPLVEPLFFVPFLALELVLLLVVVVVVVVVVCEPLPLLPLLECCAVRAALLLVRVAGLTRRGLGVAARLVVDEVELDEVEVEVEDDEEEDDGEPLPVVVVVGGGVQDSDDETTPAGRLRLESGVPGATPGNVSTWPVISFTVIVHVSACATGIAARA